MRIVRFMKEDQELWGVLRGEEEIVNVRDAVTLELDADRTERLRDIRLISPVSPGKIVAVGLNYRAHAEEMKIPIPEEPILFMKPRSSVVGPHAEIILPSMSRRIDYEGELAVVIGKRARKVLPEDAREHILGYTCLDDVTARDLQKKDGQWTRAKSFDTFCPVGPWIETELDPSSLMVRTYLNGERVQSASTSDLIFTVPELVSFISHVMTLDPGDVIATGTPSGVGPMKHGDRVEVVIDGIGVLCNTAQTDQEGD